MELIQYFARTTPLAALLTLAAAGCSPADDNSLTEGSGGASAWTGAGGATGAPPSLMPCDVAAIVSEKCTLCHAATPRYNAPMPLMTVADFHAASPPVYERAIQRINTTDSTLMMPPAGTVSLTPAQKTRLSEWLSQGATGSPTGCWAVDPEAPPPMPGSGGTFGAGGAFVGGGGTLSGAGGAFAPGSGGVVGGGGQNPIEPVQPPPSGMYLEPYPGWDADPDLQCYPFVAHDGTKQGKYRVGSARDAYFGFGFMLPWQGKRYVRAFRKVTDNAQVLHHWLFFKQSAPVQDGSVTPQLGAHPDGQLMHGWAPGGGDLYFTPDIGVEMSSDTGYLLELHYNSSDPNAMDASGVEICVTSQPPENITVLSWLGTDAISGTSSSGTCRPRANQRIRILAGTPHMHLKGRHMKVVVNRTNGQQDVVHDEPFAFENQRVYPEDFWLEPGDTITTTCTFSSPATFGRGTNEEMCYWFAMHYPALALSDGAPLGTLIHGQNSCLGL